MLRAWNRCSLSSKPSILAELRSCELHKALHKITFRTLPLRADEVNEGQQKEDVLRNAKLTFEDFYVAPPGNIALEQEKKYDVLLGDVKSPVCSELSSVELKKVRRKA